MDESELRESLTSLHAASYAWAVLCCRDPELAEDVLQSVYVKILDRGASHAGRSSFKTWLFAVIRNAARDRLRKRWWSNVVHFEFAQREELRNASSVDDTDGEEVAAVRAALSKLSERQRQIAHLVFYEDFTVERAAQVMGVRTGTARQHFARAKQKLKILLQRSQVRSNESINK